MLKESNGMVLFDALVASVRTLRDKSASLTLHLQEIPKGRGGTLMELNQEHVAVLIKPFQDEFSAEEAQSVIDFNPDKFDIGKDKSPSKRLRNVIWKCWQSQGSIGDPDLYYMKRMEEIINDEKRGIL